MLVVITPASGGASTVTVITAVLIPHAVGAVYVMVAVPGDPTLPQTFPL
jgi:hypothetical protein